MYADRYTAERRTSPAGLAMSLAATGAVLVGLATAAPRIVAGPIAKIIEAVNIDVPPPPPPEPMPQPEHPRAQQQQQIQRIDPIIKMQVDTGPGPVTVDLTTHADPGPATGTGEGTGTIIDLPKPPVLVDSRIDPRYAADFQPFYPPSERRIGREGRVVVRVLIGTDGRVHAVEPVSATSDAFLDATRRRALERWRFKPAMRDGVAVESWREMAVRFQLEDDG